jgi:DNA repair protein RadC
MNKKLSINSWAIEDRPREKMIMHGASCLSNAELLAILIGSGNRDESAVDLMKRVLANYRNDLVLLDKASFEELCSFKGIGSAKAITILAALEFGKRRANTSPQDGVVIRCSDDIYHLFYPQMCNLGVEECWILLLNQGAKVLEKIKISSGGLTATLVDVRCIMRDALLKRATSLVVCHNHPSGNVHPSQDDDNITMKIRDAATIMNIRLLDHVILTDGNFYSYADEGRI